jgi:hypothetical protein
MEGWQRDREKVERECRNESCQRGLARARQVVAVGLYGGRVVEMVGLASVGTVLVASVGGHLNWNRG